jgi:hypothetical protein
MVQTMKNSSFIRLWRTPLLLAALILFGLLAALLGTGIWHWLSWIALSIPPGVIVWYIL